MRDVASYLRGDPEERLRDAAWGEEEETDAERLDRLQAEPRGRHHLDCGARCTCAQCRAGNPPTGPRFVDEPSHRPCGHKGPGGLRCNRLAKRDEGGDYWHDGAHGAFSATGDYVQWS